MGHRTKSRCIRLTQAQVTNLDCATCKQPILETAHIHECSFGNLADSIFCDAHCEWCNRPALPSRLVETLAGEQLAFTG